MASPDAVNRLLEDAIRDGTLPREFWWLHAGLRDGRLAWLGFEDQGEEFRIPRWLARRILADHGLDIADVEAAGLSAHERMSARRGAGLTTRSERIRDLRAEAKATIEWVGSVLSWLQLRPW